MTRYTGNSCRACRRPCVRSWNSTRGRTAKASAATGPYFSPGASWQTGCCVGRTSRRYPLLPETTKEIKPAVRNLEYLLLFGFDNTPTYTWNDGKTLPEVTEGWQRLVNDTRPARIRPLLAELVKRVAANGGRLGSADRVLFARYGYGEEFDRWLEILKSRMEAAGQVPK